MPPQAISRCFICIVDHHTNDVVLRTQIPADPKLLLEALGPYRPDVVIAVECLFAWYWVADLCRRENIPFVLGHALYMKAIHGGKAKNDDAVPRLGEWCHIEPSAMPISNGIFPRRSVC